MFKNLKLAQQLGLGFAAVLVLLVAVAGTSFWAINAASNSLLDYEALVAQTEASWEQQDDVSQMRVATLANLVRGEHKYIEEAEALERELLGDLEGFIAETDDLDKRQQYEKVAHELEQYRAGFEKIDQLWQQRNDTLQPMVDGGAEMIALMDEVIADFTRDRNVTLLSHAALAQKELIFGRLYVVKYLEDNSEKQFNIGAEAMGDQKLGALIASLATKVKDPEIQDDLVQFETLRRAYVDGLHQLHDTLTERNALIDSALFELAPRMFAELESLKAIQAEHQRQVGHEAEATDRLGLILVSVLSLLAILIGSMIAILIPRSIRKPIGGEPGDIEAVTNRIAAGDLTVAFDNTGKETGIYAAMRGMTAQLTKIVSDVSDSAGTVSSASSQIAAGSQELSQRTEEQASSLEETAASIEQMTSTVNQNADNAQEASQLAEGARDNASKGGAVVKRAQSAMDEISSASNQIKEIIEVIEGISFQTNLLSLNASVEAARAGEQGRGFAVVAGEVGKLASKSSDAAKDIKTLINSTVDKVESGAALVAESGAALEEIIGSVNRVTDIVAEIAAASQEQAAGISQVNKAVTQMDEVTQHNSSLVEETAAAAEALSEQAEHLKELIGFFQVANVGAGSAAARVVGSDLAAAPNGNQTLHPRKQAATASTADDQGDWKDF